MTKFKVTIAQVTAVKYLLGSNLSHVNTKEGILKAHAANPEGWSFNLTSPLNGLSFEVLTSMLWFPELLEVEDGRTPEQRVQAMYEDAAEHGDFISAEAVRKTAAIFGYIVKEEWGK